MAEHLTGELLNIYQYDILWDLLSDNPLLPKSTLAFKDKSLKTTQQNIIKAINELLIEANKATETSLATSHQLNSLVGNVLADPTVKDLLTDIDVDVIHALSKIHKIIIGTNSADISSIAPSIYDAILILAHKIDEIFPKLVHYGYTQNGILSEDNLSFILNKVPVNVEDMRLVINGVIYHLSKGHFIYKEDTNSILWQATSANNGFDLDNTLEYTIIYDILDVVV